MFKNLFKSKVPKYNVVGNPNVSLESPKTDYKLPEIPKGWFVYEAGQDPLNLLWFVNLVNFDDFANNASVIRNAQSIENDSFIEALDVAIKQIL
jgi:hypothetical protein